MDGNGRWAQKRNLPRNMGHKAGAEAMKKIVSYCIDAGVKYATFYAFSTENWKRPEDEVNTLMRLFDEYLDNAFDFKGNKQRIKFLGDKSPFPEKLRQKMIKLEQESACYDRMTIMLAMNYGGRDDIVYAAKRLAAMSADGSISPGDIDEKLFSEMLYTSSAPDADLIIRTSGEQRISNFLLWQGAYAEYYFTDVLWPDFDKTELKKAFDEYAKRNRRFGGV